MKKTLVLALLLMSTSGLALPQNGKAYRIKTHHNNYVRQNGNTLELGDDKGPQSIFTVERRGTSYFLKAANGHYLSAVAKSENDKDSLGAVNLQAQPKEGETLAFEQLKNTYLDKYSIKSVRWNTYLRANPIKVLDQTHVNDAWELFTFVEVPSFDLGEGPSKTYHDDIKGSVELLKVHVRMAYDLRADGQHVFVDNYGADDLLEKAGKYDTLDRYEQFALFDKLLKFNFDLIDPLHRAVMRHAGY